MILVLCRQASSQKVSAGRISKAPMSRGSRDVSRGLHPPQRRPCPQPARPPQIRAGIAGSAWVLPLLNRVIIKMRGAHVDPPAGLTLLRRLGGGLAVYRARNVSWASAVVKMLRKPVQAASGIKGGEQRAPKMQPLRGQQQPVYVQACMRTCMGCCAHADLNSHYWHAQARRQRHANAARRVPSQFNARHRPDALRHTP
jgi:hypothetical protein